MAKINHPDGVLVTPEMLKEMVDYIRKFEDIIGRNEKSYLTEIYRRIGYTDLLFRPRVPKRQRMNAQEHKNWQMEQEELSVIYERLVDDDYVFDYQYYAQPCRVLEASEKLTKILVKVPFKGYETKYEHIEPQEFVIIRAQSSTLIEAPEDYRTYRCGYKSLERSVENPKLSLAFNWFANQSIYEQWSDYVKGFSLPRDKARGVSSFSKNTDARTVAHMVLDLEPGANVDEVKVAYRKLSAIHHPDKGGDHEQMAKINTAYDTLMS